MSTTTTFVRFGLVLAMVCALALGGVGAVSASPASDNGSPACDNAQWDADQFVQLYIQTDGAIVNAFDGVFLALTINGCDIPELPPELVE